MNDGAGVGGGLVPSSDFKSDGRPMVGGGFDSHMLPPKPLPEAFVWVSVTPDPGRHRRS